MPCVCSAASMFALLRIVLMCCLYVNVRGGDTESCPQGNESCPQGFSGSALVQVHRREIQRNPQVTFKLVAEGKTCGHDLSNSKNANCRDACATNSECKAYTTFGTWCAMSSTCKLQQASANGMAWEKKMVSEGQGDDFTLVAKGKTCGHDLSNSKNANCRDACATNSKCEAYTTFGTWCAMSSKCKLKDASANGKAYEKKTKQVLDPNPPPQDKASEGQGADFTLVAEGKTCGHDLSNSNNANCRDACATNSKCAAYTTFGTWCAMSSKCKLKDASPNGKAYKRGLGPSPPPQGKRYEETSCDKVFARVRRWNYKGCGKKLGHLSPAANKVQNNLGSESKSDAEKLCNRHSWCTGYVEIKHLSGPKAPWKILDRRGNWQPEDRFLVGKTIYQKGR